MTSPFPLRPGRPVVLWAAFPLVVASTVLMSPPASAGQSIVIVAGREPLPAERVGADVIVLDRTAIDASSADSLADLLKRDAGVQLSRNGGPGQSTGVLLRGAAAVNTVVLIDGVRVGSATLGFAQLEALPLAQVERIEVLRGPASSLVGADAVGGVVHIVTRQAAGTRVEARAGAGGYGAREASATVSGAADAWRWTVSAAAETAEGVSALRPGDAFGSYNPDADGYRLGSVQGRLEWRPAAGHRLVAHAGGSRLNAQYDAAEYAPPNYLPDSTPDFRNRLRSSTQGLEWTGLAVAGAHGTLRWGQAVDDLASGGTVADRYRTERRQWTAQARWATGGADRPGSLVVALEHLEEDVTSTVLLQPVRRQGTALAAAWSGRLTSGPGAPDWQVDLRRDDRSDVSPVHTGRAAVSWPLGPGWRLRAVAGTTFRAPSVNELAYPGYGVPTLRPEQGRSLEAGLIWAAGSTQASLGVYRNRVRDLIGYESDAALCPPDPAYMFGCARNIGRATLQGASASGAVQAGPWTLKASMDWLDARDEVTGTRLNRRAAWQGHAAVQWRRKGWMLGAALQGLGARPDGGVTLPSETTLDLEAQTRLASGWTLVARLRNATDVAVQPARDYQGLGRQAWLGVRYGGVGP